MQQKQCQKQLKLYRVCDFFVFAAPELFSITEQRSLLVALLLVP